MSPNQFHHGNNYNAWQPFSIVIPAHHEANFLPKTFEAWFDAFGTIKANSQGIVVDDASTDGTAEAASATGAHVVPVNPRNNGAVRNAGAANFETLADVFGCRHDFTSQNSGRRIG